MIIFIDFLNNSKWFLNNNLRLLFMLKSKLLKQNIKVLKVVLRRDATVISF